MSPVGRRVPAVLFALLAFASSPLAVRAASAQACSPAVCGASFHHLSFEGLAAGTSVEGLGAVDPLLAIASVAWTFGPTCVPGTAAVIETGNVVPFASYGAGGGNVPNDCLNGVHGFGDAAGCVLDYDFTFAPGVTVSCFSIRMVDFGDLFPFGTAAHQVLLTAYDASNNVVDTDALNMFGPVDLGGGDACVTQAAPGNTMLAVSGAGIVRVSLTFDASPDPNVGFDDITFCEVSPTGTTPRSWGGLKLRYR